MNEYLMACLVTGDCECFYHTLGIETFDQSKQNYDVLLNLFLCVTSKSHSGHTHFLSK